ncbi:uncharacterized protein [Acropora muricata]|uniref:uncharacterized protein isoform X4 n=1 Tax=Acropora muricata TaxID=159855 RepID=UPI0034E49A7D
MFLGQVQAKAKMEPLILFPSRSNKMFLEVTRMKKVHLNLVVLINSARLCPEGSKPGCLVKRGDCQASSTEAVGEVSARGQ